MQKIFGVLDTRPSVRQRPGAVDMPRSGEISVDHVTFAYGDNEPVLHDVSLHVADGERIALVGPTGAGKSTLAKLVARFYDPVAGSIKVGDVDLRDASHVSLRDRIVVVPQEGFLFAWTLRDNVRVGRTDATDADVEDALRALGLLDRFVDFPDGLETEVRERGSRLSAGSASSRHRARRPVGPDPRRGDVEPRPGTERSVEQAMERLMHGRTVLVVAHRLSTAARADRIAVVFDGKLAELGTHDELVAREGHYAPLYSAWAVHQATPDVA